MPTGKPKSRQRKESTHRVSIDYAEYKRLQKDCKNRSKKKNGNQPIKMYSKSFYGLLAFGVIIGFVIGIVVCYFIIK